MIRSGALIEARLRGFGDLLRGRGMSVTHQRLAVYRSLLEDDAHPDAERVYARVRTAVPTISLGTVYKALGTLKDLGVIAEVDSLRSATRYEALLEPHNHLICNICGEIKDISEPPPGTLRLSAKVSAGFEVSSCSVQFRGTCSPCAQKIQNHPNVRQPRAGAKQGGP